MIVTARCNPAIINLPSRCRDLALDLTRLSKEKGFANPPFPGTTPSTTQIASAKLLCRGWLRGLDRGRALPREWRRAHSTGAGDDESVGTAVGSWRTGGSRWSVKVFTAAMIDRNRSPSGRTFDRQTTLRARPCLVSTCKCTKCTAKTGTDSSKRFLVLC